MHAPLGCWKTMILMASATLKICQRNLCGAVDGKQVSNQWNTCEIERVWLWRRWELDDYGNSVCARLRLGLRSIVLLSVYTYAVTPW